MSFPPRYRSAPPVETDGAQSRRKAIEVAEELFSTKGFRGTSIAKVAEAAGLSQSGLLHHFPSKNALLTAVLDHREALDGNFLARDGAEVPLGWAAFDATAALVARNSARPKLVGLFVKLSAEAIEEDHPGHRWITDHYTSIYTWLTEAIRVGVERGEFKADIPAESVARTTIAVMDGLQTQWLVDRDNVSMVRAFSEHLDAVRYRWCCG